MTPGIDIAVVGAGPAGLYAAEELSARRADVRVDVLDRMPVPFGLVGYGIAPDHVRTKRVANLLRCTLERQNVRFLGGVEIGRGVSLEDLARCYDGVVLATGASRSARLGIPGEDLSGSVAAVDFMAWANAHPDGVAPPLDSPAAVIVGAGNVALDVARLLLAQAQDLSSTDMPPAVLAAFAASAVRDVHLLCRGGPAQARFTAKELLEVGEAGHVRVIVDAERPLPHGNGGPLAQANLDALERLMTRRPPAAAGGTQPARRLWLHFAAAPARITGDSRVTGVEVNGRAARVLPAGLVVRAIGHRSVPVGALPFDAASGRIVHDDARVPAGRDLPPVYVAGWARRGATGVVATNRACAADAVTRLLAELSERAPARRADRVDDVLRRRGVTPVGYDGWTAIDNEERARGERAGRPRVKVGSWADLRALASRAAGEATP
jgi:ferredoxin/flavodoxin---NADP+ reductase